MLRFKWMPLGAVVNLNYITNLRGNSESFIVAIRATLRFIFHNQTITFY